MLDRLKLALSVLLGAGAEPPAPAPEPFSAPVAVERHAGDGAGGERLAEALIACLDLLDPGEEAAEDAAAALAAAGIVRLDPEGARFDRTRHRAQGRVPTDDPARDWVVASTVAVGWTDGERVLRPAEVWVFRLEGPGEDGN